MKHVCWTWERTLVVGRALGMGIDKTGREGNFVFHNLIFDMSAWASRPDSPLDILDSAEAVGFFLDREFEPGVTVFDGVLTVTSQGAGGCLSRELREALIAVLLTPSTTARPILLRGDDAAVLDVIRFLMPFLPAPTRWRTSFDTFVSGGDSTGLSIVALPSGSDYAAYLPPRIAEVDLAAQTLTWQAQPVRNTLASRLASLQPGDPAGQALVTLVGALDEGDWVGFDDTLAGADAETFGYVADGYRARLIEHIANDADSTLCELVRDRLGSADLDVFARNVPLMSWITNDPRFAHLLVSWCVDNLGHPERASWALTSPLLLDGVLKRTRSIGRERETVLALTLMLPDRYSVSAENAILSALEAIPPFTERQEAQLAALKRCPVRDSQAACRRLVAAAILGDASAPSRLVEQAGACQYFAGRPSLLAWTAALLLDAPEGRVSYERLVADVFEGRLASSDLHDAIVNAMGTPKPTAEEAKEIRQIGKFVLRALRPWPDAPWTKSLRLHVEIATGLSAGGGLFRRKRGRS